jgi:arylsulfatase A
MTTKKNPANKPNIVFILADDMGYADIGALNFGAAQTPALDGLMREGIFLSQHYAASAVCTPSRASLMTGRYPHRTGAAELNQYNSLGLNEKTVAEMLAAGGYATGLVGKWHLGWDDPRLRPAARGFQRAATLVKTAHWDWVLDDDGVTKEHDGRYLADMLTDEAVDFIQDHQHEPFFLYLAHFAPHSPLEAPEEDIEPFRQAGFSENVSILYGMIRRMDKGIARVLDELKRLGLEENTLVVFASDNGPMFGATWTDRTSLTRYNAGLRGHKDLVYEGGVRVPGIIRWPAGLPGGQRIIHHVFHFNDWLPTLLEVAGLEPPSDVELDGVSQLSMLRENETSSEPPSLCWQFSRYMPTGQHNAAIREGIWKLVRPCKDDVTGPILGALEPSGILPRPADLSPGTAYVPPLPDPLPPQLFNLADDPGETHDLAEEYPDIVADLSRKLDAWYTSVNADMQKALRPETCPS